MKVNESIFREYDVRGIVGEDLSEEFARIFGCAFGTYLINHGTKQAIVGYDARESSPAYFQAAIDGLISTGLDVVSVGMITSPMMYWARKFYEIDGGLAITASHNPPEYNGFKVAMGEGALFGEAIQEIKKLMISEDFEAGKGNVVNKKIYEDYYEDIFSRVKLARKLSVIVDCGNSTGGPFAPTILEKIGCKVTPLFCDIDFSQPNHPPDPVDPRAYGQIVEMIKNPPKGEHFDMGVLFDGDADRLGAVDENGEVVRGDLITALCARKILNQKKGSKILFEIQCSKSATDDVEAHGGKVVLTRVGHSPIEDALKKEGGELAGETSGHLFFKDRWYGFDDAIYAACRLLEYVSELSSSLGELVALMPKYISTPTTRIFAPDGRKFQIIEELKKYFSKLNASHSSEIENPEILTIDGIRLDWKDGWAVVRASNTQPQLTLRAEAVDQNRLGEIKKVMEEALLPYKKEGIEISWGKVH